MKMNDPIRHIALVGTDRSPVHPESLPGPLHNLLSVHSSNESLVLDAISYTCFSNEFGYPLATSPETFEESIIEEKLPYASQQISNLLTDILSVDLPLRQPLLRSWLEMMQTRGELLLPANVLSLLNAGNTQPESIREMIIKVIGNRGKKIIPFLPEGKYRDSGLSTSHWHEGTTDQRRQYFHQLRLRDPQQAIDLLSENWNEENIRDKAGFLRIIAQTLAPSDLPFLENLYTSVFAGVAFQKTTERECKLWISHMLMRLNYPPLTELIRSGLSPYVIQGQSKSLLNRIMGKKMNELNLPKVNDSFWNGKNLNELAGLEEKNLDPLHFDHDPLFWLNGLIEIIPFQFWNELLQSDYKQTVDYFLNHDQFQTLIKGNKIAIFQNALLEIAILTKDQKLAIELIEMVMAEELIPLISHMQQPVFEKFMENNLSGNLFEFLNRRSDDGDQQWSLAFTRKVIQQYITHLNSGKLFIHAQHGYIIARFADLKVMEILYEALRTHPHAPWQGQWQKLIIEPVEQYHSIKIKTTQFTNHTVK